MTDRLNIREAEHPKPWEVYVAEIAELRAAYREAVEALEKAYRASINLNLADGEWEDLMRDAQAVLAKARAAGLGEQKQEHWEVADDLYNVMRSPAKEQPKPVLPLGHVFESLRAGDKLCWHARSIWGRCGQPESAHRDAREGD